jgi:hypothetical protein
MAGIAGAAEVIVVTYGLQKRRIGPAQLNAVVVVVGSNIRNGRTD